MSRWRNGRTRRPRRTWNGAIAFARRHIKFNQSSPFALIEYLQIPIVISQAVRAFYFDVFDTLKRDFSHSLFITSLHTARRRLLIDETTARDRLCSNLATARSRLPFFTAAGQQLFIFIRTGRSYKLWATGLIRLHIKATASRTVFASKHQNRKRQ